MNLARAFFCAALVVCMTAGTTARAQESLFANVSSAFRPGPYTFLKVDPTNAERFAVSTSDGAVLQTIDAGASAIESLAIPPRIYFPMVLRGLGGGANAQFGRSFGRQAHRLFISMLSAGMQTTRWAPWMAMEDPSTEILDIALSQHGGHGAIAGPNGIFVSDERMTVWTRALGFPRPKGNVIAGLSVAFDPEKPNVLFAGTNDGLYVSWNGGASFTRHPDKQMLDESVRKILWDQKDPKTVFLLAGGTIYKSENRGLSFEAALSIEGDIRAMAQAEEGFYVAHDKGLTLYGSDGSKDLIKDEGVVGIVPMGQGAVLAATDTQIFLVNADGKRPIMNTIAADSFIKLEGTAELAWALTKYGIYRIGVKEPRRHRRAKKGPRLLMTSDEVGEAVLKHMLIGDPTKSRLNDRWYASLMPRVTLEVKQQVSKENSLTYDGSFPLGFRYASAQNGITCCGSFGTTEPQALVMLNWDLSKIIAGQYGNVSMPFGLVEQGLRTGRTKMLDEVRWRYREIRQLCAQLRYPPDDRKTRLFWLLRLEEYAEYIDALTGKKIVDLSDMEDPYEDPNSSLPVFLFVLAPFAAHATPLNQWQSEGSHGEASAPGEGGGDAAQAKAKGANKGRAFGKLRQILKSEPTCRDVQQAALRFYKLEPERIRKMATASRVKALVPEIEGSIDNSVGHTYTNTLDGLLTPGTLRTLDPFNNPDGFKERVATNTDNLLWRVRAVWNLDRLIFNSEELDVKSLNSLEENLVREVTTLYYQRHRLIANLILSTPEEDEETFYELLRLDEQTSTIDALTGGYFGPKAWRWESEVKW